MSVIGPLALVAFLGMLAAREVSRVRADAVPAAGRRRAALAFQIALSAAFAVLVLPRLIGLLT